MKTYEMMMLEVMTMTDMNKIKGGTQDQRRIAQERQRAREKKNAQSDPLSKAAPGVKAPPTPTKASAATDPLKKAAPGVSSSAIQKSTGLAKKETKALPPSKGGSMVPSKKSQMGKWSQGIKQSPGKLAKKSPTPPNKVNKVKVKVDEPGPSKNPPPNKPQQKKKGFKMPNIPKPKLSNPLNQKSFETSVPIETVHAKDLDGPEKGPADKAKP